MGESLAGPQSVDAFLAGVPGAVGQLARDAAALLRGLLPGAVETCEGGDVGFGTLPGYRGLVFTLTPQADHVLLGFANGATLDDPVGVLEGRGKGARFVRLTTKAELERPALQRLLRQGVSRKSR